MRRVRIRYRVDPTHENASSMICQFALWSLQPNSQWIMGAALSDVAYATLRHVDEETKGLMLQDDWLKVPIIDFSIDENKLDC